MSVATRLEAPPTRLRPVDDPAPVEAPPQRPSLAERLAKWRWFLGLVAAPTLLAAIYYGLVAAPVYVSESQFVLRSSRPVQSAFSQVLQTVGVAPAAEEANFVAEFLDSRDLVRNLERNSDLRAVMSRDGADFWQRFPRPFERTSFEHLHKAYPRFVTFRFDSATGVGALSARAFRPEDANAVAEAILANSETFINRLNDQVRSDAISSAKLEIAEAEERVRNAQAALTAYRLDKQILDPESAGSAALEIIAQLEIRAASDRARLDAFLKDAPGSPQIPLIRGNIEALERQIAEERRKLVGEGRSLVNNLSEFERLHLERRFAEEALAAANVALETARLEARQKEIYLQRIAEPNLPDYPIRPRRARGVLLVFVSSMIAFGVLWLLSAGVREHAAR